MTEIEEDEAVFTAAGIIVDALEAALIAARKGCGLEDVALINCATARALCCVTVIMGERFSQIPIDVTQTLMKALVANGYAKELGFNIDSVALRPSQKH